MSKDKLKIATAPLSTEQMLKRFLEELYTIVKNRDMKGIDEWIGRYVKKIDVGFQLPAPGTIPIGMDPLKHTQMKIAGHLGLAVAQGAIWREIIDAEQAKKGLSAEIYFIDVLDKLTPTPEKPEKETRD